MIMIMIHNILYTYINVYIYIYIYTHTYIHTYLALSVSLRRADALRRPLARGVRRDRRHGGGDQGRTN